MTLVAWNGGPIFRNGAVGTGQACCCGGCSGPCSTSEDCPLGCECVEGQCVGDCSGCCGFIPENCRIVITVVARGTTVTTTFHPNAGGIFDPPVDDPLLPSYLPGTFLFGDCQPLASSSGVSPHAAYRCCCFSYEEVAYATDIPQRSIGVSYLRCDRCCNSLGEKLGGQCTLSDTVYEYVPAADETAEDAGLATSISFTMQCSDEVPPSCPCSSPAPAFFFTAPAGFTVAFSGAGGAGFVEDADGRLWFVGSYWNECMCKWVVTLNGGCYSQWRALLDPEADCQPPAGPIEWFSAYCIPYLVEGRLEDCEPIEITITK